MVGIQVGNVREFCGVGFCDGGLMTDFHLVPFEPDVPTKPELTAKDRFIPTQHKPRKANADSPQVRMTYLIIDYVDCPVCSAKATQLCQPLGLSPSVFNTHVERLKAGEVLHEVQRFRAEEQRRLARKHGNS